MGDHENLITGRVIEILENKSYNEAGVEVAIDDGFTGYVLNILDDWPSKEELQKMIECHETESFELKASFTASTQKSFNLVLELAKEITAFLNSKEGGYLCLGVNDNTEIIGLESDFNDIKRRVAHDRQILEQKVTKQMLRDALELTMNSMIGTYIYQKPPTFNLPMKFYDFDGKDVCLIKLTHRKIPFFVSPQKKPDDEQAEFRVRVGTSKKSLNIPDAVKYIWDVFGKYDVDDAKN